MNINQLSPTSFNGNAINDGTNYRARFPLRSEVMAKSTVIYSDRVDLFPLNSGKKLQSKKMTLLINTVAGTEGQLAQWFDTSVKTPQTLLCTDSSDSATWYVSATPIQFEYQPGQSGLITVQLEVADPIWRKSTATSTTQNITASAQTFAVSNSGTKFARPVITITPKGARGNNGYLYYRWLPIYNGSSSTITNHPYNVINANLDTAALVADTTVSNQINNVGGITAIQTTIPIDTSVGGGLGTSGMGYVDTEQITWTGNSAGNLTGCTRGVNGTTAAIHADNAVIKRSKMQADGGDVAVIINGSAAGRWFGGGGMNSATTRIFANFNFAPKSEATLMTAIAGAGAVTTIYVDMTVANLTALQQASAYKNKVLIIDSEAFTWTSVSLATGAITGVTRTVRNTTIAAHSVGATVRFLEHDVYLAYGNYTMTNPTVDDNYKPMIDMVNSTNTSWVYTDYYDLSAPLRTASWKPAILSSLNQGTATPSRYYGADHYTNTTLTSLCSEMGMSLQAFVRLAWLAETGEIEWRISSGAGFTTVSTSGEKYRATASWPALAALQYPVGSLWVTAWNEATPASVTTWTAFSQAGTSLGGTRNTIRYVFKGSIAASASNLAHFEVDSITLVVASPPVTAFLGAETATYELDCTLTNNTTGKAMYIKHTVALNGAIVIDCDNKTIVDSAGINIRGALRFSDVRLDWMTVEVGSNTIQYDETGVTNLDVNFTFNPRSL